MNGNFLRCSMVVFLVALFCLFAASDASAQLKINQVYGGGGLSALGYKYDYIELTNTGNVAVAYQNIYLFVGFYNGTHYNVTVPSVNVMARGFYLVRFAGAPSNPGVDLTTQDFDAGNIPLPGGNSGDDAVGVVILYSVNPNNPSSCNVMTGLLDKVSYGGFLWTNCYEGMQSYLCTDGTHALERRVFDGLIQDTDNNYSDFILVAPNPRNSQSTPLPVQLANIEAVYTSDKSVSVTWSTVSEVDNYGFSVERRGGDNPDFAELSGSFQKGHGTTTQSYKYSFTDISAQSGIDYQYRIKQMDLTGSIHYSEPVNVTDGLTAVGTQNGVAKVFALKQNYPNPFNPSTQLEFTVKESGSATLRVYNALGQQVSELFNESAQAGMRYVLRFDAAKLSSGIYLARLESGGQMASTKMTLIK